MARMEAKGRDRQSRWPGLFSSVAQLHGLAPGHRPNLDVNLGGTSGIALAVLRGSSLLG